MSEMSRTVVRDSYEPPSDEQLVNFVAVMIQQHYPGASKATVKELLDGHPIVKDAWLQRHRQMQAEFDAFDAEGMSK